VLFGRKLEDPWRCDAYEVLDGRKPPQADNASQEDFMQLSEFILTNMSAISPRLEAIAQPILQSRYIARHLVRRQHDLMAIIMQRIERMEEQAAHLPNDRYHGQARLSRDTLFAANL
jgi:hypothetical protein